MSSNRKEYPIANPDDAEMDWRLFLMWFGQVGTTYVYVWARSFDDAWEEAVEWLEDEGFCGYFTTITERDFREAAKKANVPWPGMDAFSGVIESDADKVLQIAEADLTMVGHLPKCEKKIGGPLYVPSWEWGGDEIQGGERDAVYRRSVSKPIKLSYAVLNIFQRYWDGQSDPLYAVLSRRGTSVDWVTVEATPEELERLEETAEEILEDDESTAGEQRTAEALLKRLEDIEY